MAPPFYVDETAGSDLTGVGSQEAPYQSLAYALFVQGHSATVLIRKDSSIDYEEPTQSAIKKAKKGADGLEKKRRKAEELAEREAQAQGEEREKRERLLEESKKIELVEDASLSAAIQVRCRDTLTKRIASFNRPFTVKDSEPQALAREARPCFWLGASLTLPERYHIYRPPRWYRISASRTLWRACAQFVSRPISEYFFDSCKNRHKYMQH
jgi:hypothetical protein